MVLHTRRRLRLGLVVPGPMAGIPPILSLVAKARWSALWLPEGQPPPAGGSEEAVQVGWTADQRGVVPRHPGALWLRGPAARDVAETMALLRGGRHRGSVSADVVDLASADAARRAGALPVIGPAPLDELVLLARQLDGAAAVSLPASPGRTVAEARARLTRDRDLAAMASQAPALIGTLEQCQDSVLALLDAGVGELRLRLPATPDLPDVLAQMSALGAEALLKLRPGQPRSPAPSAPEGWGGRP